MPLFSDPQDELEPVPEHASALPSVLVWVLLAGAMALTAALAHDHDKPPLPEVRDAGTARDALADR